MAAEVVIVGNMEKWGLSEVHGLVKPIISGSALTSHE
jgi:hypothetical protein